MMFLKLFYTQLRYKWGVSLLVFLAMLSLVTLYVYLKNTSQFTNRSMQLVMKNMGHNLLILPEEADAQHIYLCSEDQTTFPEKIAHRMSRSLSLASKYYVAVLQTQAEIEGKRLVLTGIAPIARPDETAEKGNMISPLGSKQVRLGSEAALRLGKRSGDTVTIDGLNHKVTEVLPPKATIDDCRVFLPLSQVQHMLQKPGKIHYILSFLCLHGGSLEKALKYQESQLEEQFPEFRQISRMDIAQGRYLARRSTKQSLFYLALLVSTITVIIIAVTGVQEVNDRRQETGILVALGAPSWSLVALYLSKILLMALLASFLGFLLGSQLAVSWTQTFLIVNTRPVTFLWGQLPGVMAIACGVVVLAELFPVAKLLSLDPTTILVQE
jgi:ABC-type lipoprotein release transport system permease subunit